MKTAMQIRKLSFILIRFRFFATDAHRRTQTGIRKRNAALMQKNMP
jgi:hypothetical protein